MDRCLTESERALLVHLSRWGSDGYPIQRYAKGRKWSWGGFQGIKGPPTMFKTKREAIESFEVYYGILRELAGQEAYARAIAEQAAAA